MANIKINTLDINNINLRNSDINPISNNNNIQVKKRKFGHVKNTKSTDFVSFRNNITYDRDSLDITLCNKNSYNNYK